MNASSEFATPPSPNNVIRLDLLVCRLSRSAQDANVGSYPPELAPQRASVHLCTHYLRARCCVSSLECVYCFRESQAAPYGGLLSGQAKKTHRMAAGMLAKCSRDLHLPVLSEAAGLLYKDSSLQLPQGISK